ncbi:TIGR02234 family membrane protein [Peterkaempfera griseoplana]|uniref:TIGR02234 family membrane protein n=1 Tax=Peterkaempfera griseoplana TaxID=66896 RepID=UPI0006E1C0B4|nr:TIGR02234 family membrane protein [Peterkaempfera griseoplana]
MNASPEPRSADTSDAPRPPRSRRSLALMLLLTVAGAVLVLWAVGRTWAEGSSGGLTGAHLGATGSEISGLPGALALVGLASAVAVFAVRRAGRLAVGVLVTLAGAGAAVAAAAGAADTSAVDAKAARSAALTAVTARHVTHTAWPWLAVAGGVLLCAAGALTLARGRDWPAMSSKYEAPAGRAAAPRRRESTPSDLWNALDRGEDPTATR